MNSENLETITLGAGCFWCVEAIFNELQGVRQVASGYAGGHLPNPTYRQVCDKSTGHAEVVQVTFDPQQISLREVLDVFSPPMIQRRRTGKAPMLVRNIAQSSCISRRNRSRLPSR